jgi:hypothetical protein
MNFIYKNTQVNIYAYAKSLNNHSFNKKLDRSEVSGQAASIRDVILVVVAKGYGHEKI